MRKVWDGLMVQRKRKDIIPYKQNTMYNFFTSIHTTLHLII